MLIVCSCSDKHFAKELNGKWMTDYIMSYSDGEKDSITEYVTFYYVPNSEKDGGTFTETRYYKTNEIEDNDYNYSVKSKSSISGNYEVILGDLSLKYNVSTLVVDISTDDVKIDIKNYAELNSYLSAFSSSLTNPSEEIAKSFKKNIYKNLFEYYKEISSADDGFKDLKIHDDAMSYDTTDGRLEYKKDE